MQKLLTILLIFSSTVFSQELSFTGFQISSSSLEDIYVDPQNGSDSNSGNTANSALKSVNAAWRKIPQGRTLSGNGYRVRILPGTVPTSDLPNYWEQRYGTASFPIIFQAENGRGTVNFLNGPNIFDVKHLYFIDVDIIPNPAGDAFHCEKCEYILLRGMHLSGGNKSAHETIKFNQSNHVYIEDSDIHGADDNAIDFVSVQYGHILRNRIHDATDWCVYTKGGSAYITIAGNNIYDCGTGGYTAGQGTGFEFIDAPWIHYEAYDIKFVNNIIHDTDGAAFGVNGGYNILMAYNTAVRVGRRDHVFEAVFGSRSCDGNPSACASRVAQGGWGTSTVGTEGEPIPNKNVFVLNNIFYNPSGYQSQWQHFAIYSPRATGSRSNIPSPARSDDNLVIKGNLIWNGPADHPLGNDACLDSNPTCNASQLRRDNTINTTQPSFRDIATLDFRPTAASGYNGASSTNFSGGDRQSVPQAPEGSLNNDILTDISGNARDINSQRIGAYLGSDSNLIEWQTGGSGGSSDRGDGSNNNGGGGSGLIKSKSCKPMSTGKNKDIRCAVSLSQSAKSVSIKYNNKSCKLKKDSKSNKYT